MKSGHFGKCELNKGLDRCRCGIRRYGLILLISFVIFATEIVGGILSHSLALFSDAWHVFCDKIAIGLAILAEYWAIKFPNGKKENGVKKAVAYANIFLLLFIAFKIAEEALVRIYAPQEIESLLMTAVAVFGALGNYFQNFILKKSAVGKDVVHEVVGFHIVSDLWQSLAVIAGGAVISITGKTIVDPVLSLLIAAAMFFFGIKLLLKNLRYSDD